MKEIFNNTKAQCFICNSPVDGRYKRGDRYYCASDYERTSPEELIENDKQEREYQFYKKLVSGTS
jgi:hypothetical protein